MNAILSRIVYLTFSFLLIMAPFSLQAGAAENDGLDETTLKEFKETTLDILLIGTAPGGIERGFAIILDNQTNIQRIYRVGDYIDNAEINHVYRKQVVLKINGQKQLLSFADPRSIERVAADEVLEEYVFEPTETIFLSKPEVFIQRDKPSPDNPNAKTKVRRIIFTAKQKEPESN